MKTGSSSILPFVVCLSIAQTIFGQDHQSPLDEIIARVIKESPSLSALKARYKAAYLLIRAQESLPEPVVDLGYREEGLPWSIMRGQSMIESKFTQLIPFPGKLNAKKEIAYADAQIAEGMAREWIQRTIMEVRVIYAKIYYIDRSLEYLKVADELLTLAKGAVDARYSTGKLDQEAIVKVQMERLKIKEREVMLKTEREQQIAGLRKLLDQPDFTLEPIKELPPISLSEEDLTEDALQYSCILIVARNRLQAAKKNLDAMKLETKPNFMVSGGIGTTFSPAPVFLIGFGVELPLWTKYKQNSWISSAMEEVRAREAEVRAVTANVRAELQKRMADYNQAKYLYQLYKDGLVLQGKVAFNSALASYIAGTGDFSTVIEDLQLYIDSMLMQLKAETDLFISWASIQEMVTPIPPITGGQ